MRFAVGSTWITIIVSESVSPWSFGLPNVLRSVESLTNERESEPINR